MGLGFTNPVGTGVVCMCLRCGGVVGVGGECVGDWTRVWRVGVVLCLCVLYDRIICVDGRSRYLYIVFCGKPAHLMCT